MLWMFQRVMYGEVTNEKNAALPDLQQREWLVIVPIVAIAILMGVLPNLFLKPIGPSVERMLNQVHRGAPSRIQAGLRSEESERRLRPRQPGSAQREPGEASASGGGAPRESKQSQ